MISHALALGILASYFGLISVSFLLVFRSLLDRRNGSDLFSGSPFLFLRVAFGALLSTWYFMLKYMHWSYSDYANIHADQSVGAWLSETALFEQAWSIVCAGPINWWWSSFICTWTVIFTAIIWSEGGKRGIKYPWAYMLLGQLVAMSVATALFIAATALHPRKTGHPRRAPIWVYLPLVLAMGTIHLVPQYAGTGRFLNNLLWMHGLLLVALLTPRGNDGVNGTASLPWSVVYATLLGLAAMIHIPNTARLPTGIETAEDLYKQIFSHPAQSSISFDVIWVVLALVAWYVSTGSLLAVTGKVVVLSGLVLVGVARFTGVNWGLVASVMPILALSGVGVLFLGLGRLRSRNLKRRRQLFDEMGIEENEVIPGTDKRAPTSVGFKTLVGFFHPYCHSGGGGERVLWSAIAYLQRTRPDVVSMVYTGDSPDASKEEIIGKVHERFSIRLDPATLHFVPLPARYLISDNYWHRFTLLNQSLGSVYLAWQGLCGKDGLWGDIFIDTMGYAFTFPFVRLIAGPTITIGAYVHYPTVSTDMVKRVRAREAGVESGGASSSWLKTRVKLVYYQIFTSLYSTSLLFAEEIMTNSSWTQAHLTSLIHSSRSSFLASIFLLDNKSFEQHTKGDATARKVRKSRCEVVFPPCDTKGLEGLGKLDKRKNQMVSLAQFRPEKEHSKQLYALAELFKAHPGYRDGEGRLTLTLMGGSRNKGDEARLSELRRLATSLNIEDNVEFLVNAPYPEIVRRLGEASIGLNTMQDEHFGINVVEFMAAGLISIVHASAGPLMDIVVPYQGQKTGFHATTPESFATAMHEALSLSTPQARKMRMAARALAGSKFSQEAFERGWAGSWREVMSMVEERRGE